VEILASRLAPGVTQADKALATMGRGSGFPVSGNENMPTATLRFTLPEEQADFDAARLGSSACACLVDIDQGLRSLLKHGEPSEQTAKLAEEIREMIRQGCPDALEL
jgi:hypothetical protein